MDNRDQVCNTCGKGGYCDVCGSGRNYLGNHLLKWFLGLIIITWVFVIGMRMGEFKAQLEMLSPYGYGNHMMFRAAPPMFSVSSMPAAAGLTSASGGNVTFTAATAGTPVMKTIQLSN